MQEQVFKPGSTSQKYYPFVCIKTPFVFSNYPSTVPFIFKNIPSVIFYRNFGFTLVELIVTITIVGVLAAIAVPGLQGFVLDSRLSSQANDALSDLSFARSEAIRRGTRVTLCKTSDPTAAAPSCDAVATNPWTTGRIVFADEGVAGTINTGDTVLRVKDELDGASSSGNRLLGDSTTGSPVRISYLSTGLVENFSAGETQLRLCDSRGAAYGRAIVITNSGRVRVAPRGQAKSGALSCN